MQVYSIFESIDGEISQHTQGAITTFVRLSGCNLRCLYCDTKYAIDIMAGEDLDVSVIADQIRTTNVTITGGEPLLQYKELRNFINVLRHRGIASICIETNGTMIKHRELFGDTKWIVDYKLPNAGHSHEYMNLKSFEDLLDGDIVKFVVRDALDLQLACRAKVHLQKNNLNHLTFAISIEEVRLGNITFPSIPVFVRRLIEHGHNDFILNYQHHK